MKPILAIPETGSGLTRLRRYVLRAAEFLVSEEGAVMARVLTGVHEDKRLRHVRGQLPAREQRGLILANLLGAKLIGRTMEVPTEMLDRLDVNVDGGLGVVAAPEFFKHDLA